jgi:hypothetical protein
MDKRLAGLLGAAAALTTVTAAHATAPIQSEFAPATSYRDLLAPIPNAVAALKADDARLAQTSASDLKVAEDHHHHHHHRPPPPPKHHHHHH